MVITDEPFDEVVDENDPRQLRATIDKLMNKSKILIEQLQKTLGKLDDMEAQKDFWQKSYFDLKEQWERIYDPTPASDQHSRLTTNLLANNHPKYYKQPSTYPKQDCAHNRWNQQNQASIKTKYYNKIDNPAQIFPQPSNANSQSSPERTVNNKYCRKHSSSAFEIVRFEMPAPSMVYANTDLKRAYNNSYNTVGVCTSISSHPNTSIQSTGAIAQPSRRGQDAKFKERDAIRQNKTDQIQRPNDLISTQKHGDCIRDSLGDIRNFEAHNDRQIVAQPLGQGRPGMKGSQHNLCTLPQKADLPAKKKVLSLTNRKIYYEKAISTVTYKKISPKRLASPFRQPSINQRQLTVPSRQQVNGGNSCLQSSLDGCKDVIKM